MLKRMGLYTALLFLLLLQNCAGTPQVEPGSELGEENEIAPDLYEPDSKHKPVPVEPLRWLERTLHTNDEDWFSLTPTFEGLLVAETDGNTDTVMELYRGDTLLKENDDVGNNQNARIEYFVEPGISYTIKVAGVRLAGATENASGPYRFRYVVETLLIDTTEPNNTKDEATPITMGSAITGYFTYPEDIDWYSLPIPGRGRLTIYTEGTMDTLLSVYDDWEDRIAQDDDSGDQGNAKIVVDILAPGTVYIMVSTYQGALGRYSLHCEFRDPVKADQYENDDTMARAKDIQIGTSQERNFLDAFDEDWVRLQITRQGTYEIHTTAADNYLDTFLELMDADGVKITEDDDSGGFWDAYLKVTLSPGTYYLRITPLDKDPLEDSRYTLSVSAGQ
ncbi:bacterial pre-peptidase C- domain family [Treponema primitia ZAS-2]|uniref:Bacterial pre-peptidase C-domain family n=1 Tax=Treponema primitia (strain ATCC BAA-887 / DSM 12427 / ZAS-2) TaxID=545694 RepID=F5YL14_TREPZ|nr:pre-peptidase C-terminal domain-containing protein [Treponema primitia]AEF84296.1 bacterial pre-peptidase C- domain family [Treponema primitia ZAS-2]